MKVVRKHRECAIKSGRIFEGDFFDSVTLINPNYTNLINPNYPIHVVVCMLFILNPLTVVIVW